MSAPIVPATFDIYTLKEFGSGLTSKGQGIKHSGVGGHHHNGVAENAIKNTVRTGQTIMIYATLGWPKHISGRSLLAMPSPFTMNFPVRLLASPLTRSGVASNLRAALS
jgi:hypothetical protein